MLVFIPHNEYITCRRVWLATTADPNPVHPKHDPHQRRGRSGLCGVMWLSPGTPEQN